MKFSPFLLLVLILSGCAAKGEFPSLAHRPIEAKATDLLADPAVKPQPALPSDPALAARIAAARQAAFDSAPAFDAALATAQTAASRAGEAQSESWIAAQMAVSAAEHTRDPVKTALADLDSVVRTLMTERPTSPDLATVQQAIADVKMLDSRQNAALQAVIGSLSR